MRELVELLFPTRCLLCQRHGDLVCEACLCSLPLLTGPVCTTCGSPAAAGCRECVGRRLGFRSARSAVGYRRDVARAVGAWKEGGAWRMARVAARIIVGVVPRPAADAVTSVPPDRERALWRGHDPAGALAHELARTWQLPHQRLLERRLRVAPQKELDAERRRTNLASAFRACGRVPQAVVIIDDVYTTGATASVAALTLREAGARSVDVITFARTLRSRRPDDPARSSASVAQLESDR